MKNVAFILITALGFLLTLGDDIARTHSGFGATNELSDQEEELEVTSFIVLSLHRVFLQFKKAPTES